jgi:hypothetical protein
MEYIFILHILKNKEYPHIYINLIIFILISFDKYLCQIYTNNFHFGHIPNNDHLQHPLYV